MNSSVGPRAKQSYDGLRHGILAGVYPPGTRLPPHRVLAKEFGVALMTLRQALGQLEREGLIRCVQGRGSFVRVRTTPTVLLVGDDLASQSRLRACVEGAGCQVMEASRSEDGLAALEDDPSIALVMSSVRMADGTDVTSFIRSVRRRWPELPLAAVIDTAADLAQLQGTPECPIFVLTWPILGPPVEQVLFFALSARSAAEGRALPPHIRQIHHFLGPVKTRTVDRIDPPR